MAHSDLIWDTDGIIYDSESQATDAASETRYDGMRTAVVSWEEILGYVQSGLSPLRSG